MITLNHIERSYPAGAARYYVLRRITMDIAEGDFVTVMGPSGAGKSTLLAIIGMLDGDWTGEYFLFDKPVHKLNLKERAELNKRYVGFVFQQYHLLDNLTVAENLDIPLSYRDIKSSERQALVADSLDRFSIVGKKDLYPSQLSGGQQQLVAVARGDREPQAHPRRRAHRQPAYQPGQGNHGLVQKIERRGDHHHPGHSQRELGGLRQPHHQAARRVDREGLSD